MTLKKGFSLIELLIVIAIIASLSAMAFVYSNNARLKARDARRKVDVRAMQTAIEMYKKNSNDDTVPTPNSWNALRDIILPELSIFPSDPQNTSLNHYVYCHYNNPEDKLLKGKYIFAITMEQAGDIVSDIDVATSSLTCVGSDNSLSTGVNCEDGTGSLSGSSVGVSNVYCAGNIY